MREGGAGARERVGLVAGPALALAVLFLPWPGQPEPAARRTGAVAVWMAVWWITEALPIAVTALLPLALFPLLGVLPSSKVAPHYANHLVFLFLGGFLLAVAMERWGLHRRLALRVLAAIGTGPAGTVLGFMVATALLSMWVSNTATVLMIFPIAVAAVERMAEAAGPADRAQAEASLGAAVMMGIAYAASLGGAATLIGTPPNVVLAGMARELVPDAPEIAFAPWLLVGLPVTVLLLPVAWVLVLRLAPAVPLSRFTFEGARETARGELGRLGPMSAGEKQVLAVFGVTVMLWVTRTGFDLGSVRVPGWAGLFPHARYLHDATVVMTTSVFLFFLSAPAPPAGRAGRRRLLDWETAEARIPWGILLLFGGGFALAAGFQESGLAAWMGERLGGLGRFPLPVVVLGVCLAVTFLTEVTSNTATTTLLLPILASTAAGIGVHPFLLMVPATLSASCAFMLPVATPPNAIVFGSRWVTIPRMARTGLVLNLAGAVVIAGLVLLLVPRVLGPL